MTPTTDLDVNALEADMNRQLDRTRRMQSEPLVSLRADDLRALFAAVRERDEAYKYARNLCEAYVRRYCAPVPEWRVLPDLIGVLTQIDNAITVTAEIKSERDTFRALLAQAAEALTRASAIIRITATVYPRDVDMANECDSLDATIRKALAP